MTKIAVIDYGMGNLHSVAKALQHADTENKAEILVTADPKLIRDADKILLPGVGAMRDCIGEMQGLDLFALIQEVAQNKPFLGICIGMQALLSKSEENNGVDCLNLIPGKVRHLAKGFSADNLPLKIPHMGWNGVQQEIQHPLWNNIKQQERFYFVHSYVVETENKQHIAASATYSETFTAAICKDNIFAVQFHPEKSATAGLQLYANFISWDGNS